VTSNSNQLDSMLAAGLLAMAVALFGTAAHRGIWTRTAREASMSESLLRKEATLAAV